MFFNFNAADCQFFVFRSELATTCAPFFYTNSLRSSECEKFSLSQQQLKKPPASNMKRKINNHIKSWKRKKFFDFRFNVNSVSRFFSYNFFSPRILILPIFLLLNSHSVLRSLHSLRLWFRAEQHCQQPTFAAHSLSALTLPSPLEQHSAWRMESKFIRYSMLFRTEKSQNSSSYTNSKLEHSCDFQLLLMMIVIQLFGE